MIKFKNVVGLDLSLTSTGMVKVRVGDKKYKHWCFKTAAEQQIYDRYRQVAMHIAMHLEPFDLVLVEDYAFGVKVNRSRIIQLAELGGVVKMAVRHKVGVWPVPVSSATLRKFATGTGKGSKDDIKLQTYKKDRVEFPTTDETDAWVIAQIGLCLIGAKPTFRPKWHGYEQDCVNALLKGLRGRSRQVELQALAK